MAEPKPFHDALLHIAAQRIQGGLRSFEQGNSSEVNETPAVDAVLGGDRLVAERAAGDPLADVDPDGLAHFAFRHAFQIPRASFAAFTTRERSKSAGIRSETTRYLDAV